MDTLCAALEFLHDENGSVAVFDATNTTRKRRAWVLELLQLQQHRGVRCLFIESVFERPEMVQQNVSEKMDMSPDWVGMDRAVAEQDMWRRIRNYEAAYEPVLAAEKLPYLRLVNFEHAATLNLDLASESTLVKLAVAYACSIHNGYRPITFERSDTDTETPAADSDNGTGTGTAKHTERAATITTTNDNDGNVDDTLDEQGVRESKAAARRKLRGEVVAPTTTATSTATTTATTAATAAKEGGALQAVGHAQDAAFLHASGVWQAEGRFACNKALSAAFWQPFVSAVSHEKQATATTTTTTTTTATPNTTRTTTTNTTTATKTTATSTAGTTTTSTTTAATNAPSGIPGTGSGSSKGDDAGVLLHPASQSEVLRISVDTLLRTAALLHPRAGNPSATTAPSASSASSSARRVSESALAAALSRSSSTKTNSAKTTAAVSDHAVCGGSEDCKASALLDAAEVTTAAVGGQTKQALLLAEPDMLSSSMLSEFSMPSTPRTPGTPTRQRQRRKQRQQQRSGVGSTSSASSLSGSSPTRSRLKHSTSSSKSVSANGEDGDDGGDGDDGDDGDVNNNDDTAAEDDNSDSGNVADRDDMWREDDKGSSDTLAEAGPETRHPAVAVVVVPPRMRSCLKVVQQLLAIESGKQAVTVRVGRDCKRASGTNRTWSTHPTDIAARDDEHDDNEDDNDDDDDDDDDAVTRREEAVLLSYYDFDGQLCAMLEKHGRATITPFHTEGSAAWSLHQP
ncbi:hypothetical protein PTSG_13255 [Salpingoeca rosetta]|uniref:6-phosphofructo-2-kinase domain-containing protein n=1 Tax=Salpingoeca rosetta (strain ATCC 50818 / BSB-021) TaxID=946362 RepID=F2UE12_SALR5|nr:uncharacterized protein PTSG_13255 [Salpingoeca rosetta]EGD74862.1 hypothetical protein PTSG_13255 [Salpingoeca rosetta]|eukprot:XP_004992507.1 hypothetical protein PTSG_13255 [Salpingoeca rosetta]